jgi:Bacterial Ig domain
MRRILTTGLSLASLAYAAMASAQTGTALPPPAPQPAPNRPPTITVACEPCTVDVGQTARITAAAVDPDGDVLVYHWIAPAGVLGDATQAHTTWTAPQEEGSVALTAVADDGRGGTASDYVRIVIKRGTRSGPDGARVDGLKGDASVRVCISRGGTNDIVNARAARSQRCGWSVSAGQANGPAAASLVEADEWRRRSISASTRDSRATVSIGLSPSAIALRTAASTSSGELVGHPGETCARG